MRTLHLLSYLLRADFLACSYLPGRDACGRHGASGQVQRARTTRGAR